MVTTAPEFRLVQILPTWMRGLDPWEAATGVFIFIVMAGNSYVGYDLYLYAGMIIAMSIYSEFAMIFAAMALGDNKQERTPRELVPGVILAFCIYAGLMALLTWDIGVQFFLVQALWVLWGRFRPRAGDRALSTANLRRFSKSSKVALLVLLPQLMLHAAVTAVTNRIGLTREGGELSGAPLWNYAIVWGAYYFELAYLLPRVATSVKQQTPVEGGH